MKLCVVTNSFPRHEGDSAGKFVLESNAAVVAQGHSVHVIVPHQAGVETHAQLEGITIHRYRYAPDSLETEYGKWYSHEWVKSLKMRLVYYLRLAFLPALILAGAAHTYTYCKRNAVDWVIGHWVFPSGLTAYLGGRLAGKKVAIRAYGGDVVVLAKTPLLRQLVQFLLHHADVVLPISHTTGSEVLALDTAPEKVRVLYKGYDPDRFCPGLDGNEIRRRNAIADDQLLVLTIGRLVPYKGFSYFIDAAAKTAQQFPNARFLIGGRGPLLPELQAQITSNGLDQHVKLIGFVAEEDLPYYYAACDLYVSSSITDMAGNREGFAMTVLEAMACQKPVIVTDAGAPKEFVEHGGTGMIVAESDADALAEAMALLLGSEDVRRHLACHAAQQIKDFTWQRLAEQLVHELSQVGTRTKKPEQAMPQH